MSLLVWFGGLLLFFVLCAVRLYYVLPLGKKATRRRRRRRDLPKTCSLAVFLGSGGHTSEAISLLSSLDFSRYTPRTYYLSEGDTLSMEKAVGLEALKAERNNPDAPTAYNFVVLPRARRVHQSLLTTPLTALRSLADCVYHITAAPLLSKAAFPEVLIVNGPGTCVVLCLAAYLNRFLGLPSPTMIYVESFARVRALSLSGKLLQHFVDRFIVQWPELAKHKSRATHLGWLV